MDIFIMVIAVAVLALVSRIAGKHSDEWEQQRLPWWKRNI